MKEAVAHNAIASNWAPAERILSGPVQKLALSENTIAHFTVIGVIFTCLQAKH